MPELPDQRSAGMPSVSIGSLDYSRPGKPTDNAFAKGFNSRVRQECLNAFWFLSLDDARCKIEAWRVEYNAARERPRDRRTGGTLRLPSLDRMYCPHSRGD